MASAELKPFFYLCLSATWKPFTIFFKWFSLGVFLPYGLRVIWFYSLCPVSLQISPHLPFVWVFDRFCSKTRQLSLPGDGDTVCFSVVKMKLGFSGNPDHKFQRWNNFVLLVQSKVFGPPFLREQKSHPVREMAIEGADAFDQSKSACSTETPFVALGINIWHPGCLLSLCVNEAVLESLQYSGVINNGFPGFKWKAFREKCFSLLFSAPFTCNQWLPLWASCEMRGSSCP